MVVLTVEIFDYERLFTFESGIVVVSDVHGRLGENGHSRFLQRCGVETFDVVTYESSESRDFFTDERLEIACELCGSGVESRAFFDVNSVYHII